MTARFTVLTFLHNLDVRIFVSIEVEKAFNIHDHAVNKYVLQFESCRVKEKLRDRL